MHAQPIESRWSDDAALAASVAAGDTAAFEALMRRHNRQLYRLARAVVGDDAEAEDALQEAYLSAYASIGRFRGEATLSTWLSRLVLNECFGRLRRQGRRSSIVQIVSSDEDERMEDDVASHASTGGTPLDLAERAEVRALLERKLDALPEVFRTVFVMRGVEEMDVGEVAECLGIPEATVRSRFFRARSLLREALAQDFDLAERDVFAFGGRHCDQIVGRVLERLSKRPT
jgi:RNA polymerase sigma-70 factor (ECF subfamily)